MKNRPQVNCINQRQTLPGAQAPLTSEGRWRLPSSSLSWSHSGSPKCWCQSSLKRTRLTLLSRSPYPRGGDHVFLATPNILYTGDRESSMVWFYYKAVRHCFPGTGKLCPFYWSVFHTFGLVGAIYVIDTCMLTAACRQPPDSYRCWLYSSSTGLPHSKWWVEPHFPRSRCEALRCYY